jgi:hypothetical protein
MNDSKRMTAAERWAARSARNTTWLSLVGGLVGPALMIYIAVQSPASTFYTVLALTLVVLFVASSWWESVGFKRLLARRDAELDQLRSGGGPV